MHCFLFCSRFLLFCWQKSKQKATKGSAKRVSIVVHSIIISHVRSAPGPRIAFKTLVVHLSALEVADYCRALVVF